VQWQVSTNGGASFSNISGAISTTLSFTASAGQNGNKYRAVFTNSVASDNSAAATLAINGLPDPGACGSGRSMPVGLWTMFSLPCAPSAATVSGIFSGISGTYGTDWVVWEREEASNRYVKLDLNSPLTQGNGYWFRSLNAASFSVSGTSTPVSNGFFEIPLIKPADGNGLYNLAGHPFPYDVDWADVRVVVNNGSGVTPSAAETATKLSKTFWVWNGSGYDSYDDVTPGLTGQLQATYGMWVKVLDKNVTSIKLLIPAAAGQSALAKVVKKKPAPGEWYVRLIAEVPAEGLKDRGNVLGQLKDSKPGFDSHDLPELAPSFTPYLTVVFPGEYASDFHPVKAGADSWKFVVRTDNPGRKVKLSWEVNGKAPANMSLKDLKTGKVIQRKAGSYTFVMGSTERAFTWSVK
jgi:hypothetical protein